MKNVKSIKFTASNGNDDLIWIDENPHLNEYDLIEKKIRNSEVDNIEYIYDDEGNLKGAKYYMKNK